MLDPELVTLAMTAGTAVAKAAGTDAWSAVRDGVARLFRRGHAPDEAAKVTLERLDRTAAELEQALPAAVEKVESQAEGAWRTRFRDLLEDLPEADRTVVAAQLRELVAMAERACGGATAGDHGIAIGGNVNIKAEGGSAAALTMGDVQIGASPVDPPRPGPDQN